MESMVSAKFWDGRRVFLTGHTGFKGAWLSLWLQKLGAKAAGYALGSPTDPSLFVLANVEAGMRHRIGDVRDLGTVADAMREHAPEIVIHMAAQALVRASYEDPMETFATNVMGTVTVLEAVRRCRSVRAVLVVTSDKCYENRERPRGYREEDALGGRNPYSASKASAELVTHAYRASFFDPSAFMQHRVGIASVRAGNVLGGGDWAADRLVPDAIRAFAAGRTVAIRYPGAVRPWQHVLDPLGGYLLLAEKLFADGLAYGGAWNFGPSDTGVRPVKDVIDGLVALWGGNTAWTRDGADHPHEDGLLSLDCNKARELLAWRPRFAFDEVLALTVDWYKAFDAGADMREFTLGQIARFNEPPIAASARPR
jgi:CDP-glucose 4,6-dehydratase